MKYIFILVSTNSLAHGKSNGELVETNPFLMPQGEDLLGECIKMSHPQEHIGEPRTRRDDECIAMLGFFVAVPAGGKRLRGHLNMCEWSNILEFVCVNQKSTSSDGA